MNVNDLVGKTAMIAVSGGLDSCCITHWLVSHNVEVCAFTGDLGQPDEQSMEDVRERIMACGASEIIIQDLRKEICQAGLQLIQSQAQYEGDYWNTTGIARHVVVEAMVPLMADRSVKILSHGCTGRGNDQVRFQLATFMLDSQIEVYAPWRDPEFLRRFGGRKEMIDYCNEHQLPIRATHDAPYSTDANMLGLTHEAGELESLTTPAARVAPGMGVLPESAQESSEIVEIRFEAGLPVAVNGNKTTVMQAFEQTNEIGGRHGIGIGLHTVENRFVGIKSRGIYEAPGMELLGRCYEFLLQLVLDRRTRRLYSTISSHIAEQVYEGFWFDTSTQASWRFVEHLNSLVTGTIAVSLYKGNVSFHSASDAPHSLYSESRSSMEDVGEFDHTDSEGFLGVLGVSARALKIAGQTGCREPEL